MIRLSVQLYGSVSLLARLQAVGALAQQALVALERGTGARQRRISRRLASEIRKAFRQRRDPQIGRGWERLASGAPSTGIRTGRLYFQLKSTRPWKLRGNRLEFDLARTVWYGINRQLGIGQPRRGYLPARRTIRRIMREEISSEIARRWTA